MEIDAIGARLLDAMGVGVALIEAERLTLRYGNPNFRSWFGDPAPGADANALLTGVDLAALRDVARDGAAARTEIEVRRGRRPMVIDATFRIASIRGEALLVAECQNITRLRQTECMIDANAEMADRRVRALERETARLKRLLMDVLPRSADAEAGTLGPVALKLYEAASVLTFDFIGPADPATGFEPLKAEAELGEIFAGFDRIATIHGCRRIRTASQTYLAVAGLPRPDPEHAVAATRCATTMLRFLEHRNRGHARPWRARAGLAAGAVVASMIVGREHVFDLSGPATALASRLRERCAPMEALAPAEMLASLSETFEVGPTRTETMVGLGVVNVASVAAPGDRVAA